MSSPLEGMSIGYSKTSMGLYMNWKSQETVGIKALQSTPELLSEEGTEDYVETQVLKSTPGAPWKKRVRNPLAEHLTADLYLATTTTPDIIDFCDIT